MAETTAPAHAVGLGENVRRSVLSTLHACLTFDLRWLYVAKKN
jgi:hypothetical protein